MSAKTNKPEEKDGSSSTGSAPRRRQDVNRPVHLSMWMKLTMAIISLLLGLATPPLLIRAEEPVCTAQDGSCGGGGGQDETPPEVTFKETQPLFPCNNSTLDAYLHKHAVPGYHVVCIDQFQNENKSAKEFMRLVYYLDGFWNLTTTQTFPAPFKWKHIKFALQRKLKLVMKHKVGAYQPWAIFTPMGQRIVDADFEDPENPEMEDLILQVLLKYQTVLVYEGGQFIWPGISIGFERLIHLYSIMPLGDPDMADRHHVAKLETLSLEPLVFSVDHFLTDEECEYIQTKAEPTLEYSGVVLMDKDKGRPASDFRTSQSTFVSASGDEILLDIEYRTASLVRVPRQHQEDVQVLRYGIGEKYDHHTDFFDPQYYHGDPNTMRLIENGKKNRLATVFWYLSDVAQGGETAFPRFGGSEPRSMQDCGIGLLVKPEKGKVIIFYSLKMNGETDDKSLHGACPVKEGVKYAGNKWVWNEAMWYVQSLDDMMEE